MNIQEQERVSDQAWGDGIVAPTLADHEDVIIAQTMEDEPQGLLTARSWRIGSATWPKHILSS